MKFISLSLAWRYLVQTKQEHTINIMVTLCFIGIALGTLSLTLVIAVMRGFEQATHDHLQGTHANLIMHARAGQALAYDAIERVLSKEFPEVSATSPVATQYGIIHDDEGHLINLISLKGIDPGKEEKTTTIATKLLQTITKEKSLASLIHDNVVIIGSALAKQVGVQVGSHFQVVCAPEQQNWSKSIQLEPLNLIVGGIFKTGIEEFDSSIIFCSLDFLQTTFTDTDITTIALKTKSDIDEKKLIARLKKRFNLFCYSWKELYPALLAALKLEKYASFFILTLIILVASMSIISLLFMQITQKRTDIAILQALGASFATIRTIFFIMGFVVACAACITGLILALLIGLIVQRYVHIELPDAYFATHVPIALEPSIFLVVFAVVMTLSCLATLLSIRKINEQNIALTLKK